MNYQRDAFISELTERAKFDKDIVFLSADFGAPALDKFIAELPGQFFHLGISEQNMIDVAIGLALRGKKVFAYAMAPFVVMRCAEQHKLAALMNLPITTIVAGVGIGYANAGPTHYSTEDLGVIMGLIGSTVYTISDSAMAAACANHLAHNPAFAFVRLDRMPCQDLDEPHSSNFELGFRTFFSGQELAIISHGYMLSKILSIVGADHDLEAAITVIDLFCSKPVSEEKIQKFAKYKNLLIIDEQVEQAALGTFILPKLFQLGGFEKVKSIALAEQFMFGNTGRDALIEEAGLGVSSIKDHIRDILGK
jgi:transketolase